MKITVKLGVAIACLYAGVAFSQNQASAPVGVTTTSDGLDSTWLAPVAGWSIDMAMPYGNGGGNPPAGCTSQPISWAQSGNTCSGTVPALSNGGSTSVSATNSPYTGSVQAMCSNSALSYSTPTCSPPPPAPCAAVSNYTWTENGNSCKANLPASSSGSNFYVADYTTNSDGSLKGEAQLACSNGSLSLIQSYCDAPPAPPPPPAGLVNITQISTGQNHACALLSSGQVKCWGSNTFGQVGDGTTAQRKVSTNVSGLNNGLQVEAGKNYSCAVLNTGAVKCWGNNSFGQLGDGTTTNRSTPVAVSGLTNAKQVDVADNHTCALKNDGTVWCWGYNDKAQLGDGTTTDSFIPVQVNGISNAVEIALEFQTTCARISDGSVKCWGYNSYGEAGDGSPAGSETVPVTVATLPVVAALGTGGYGHQCARDSSNNLYCWGNNSYGQQGDGSYNVHSSASLANQSGVTQFSAGGNGSCAVLTTGNVTCWGVQVNNTGNNNSTPVMVSGLATAKAVRLGQLSDFACALKNDTSAVCWGANSSGQLGTNTLTSSNSPSTLVQ